MKYWYHLPHSQPIDNTSSSHTLQSKFCPLLYPLAFKAKNIPFTLHLILGEKQTSHNFFYKKIHLYAKMKQPIKFKQQQQQQ